jgi:asparaginyl-tRNA synthetase
LFVVAVEIVESGHDVLSQETPARKPVIVMNYPNDIKAFYMRLNDDGRTVAAMDVPTPGSAKTSVGSQREEWLEVLDGSMAECHVG